MPSWFRRAEKEPDHRKAIEKPDYQIRPGKMYLLIGGPAERIQVGCEHCGGPFAGPCEPRCEYCGVGRRTFYADATNSSLVSSIPDQTLADNSRLTLPQSNRVSLKEEAKVSLIVAHEIVSGTYLRAGTIVGHEIKTEQDADINLVIIDDDGKGTFGQASEINTLITGKNVSLIFGNGCYVQNFFHLNETNVDAGNNFSVFHDRSITRKQLVGFVSEALGSR